MQENNHPFPRDLLEVRNNLVELVAAMESGTGGELYAFAALEGRNIYDIAVFNMDKGYLSSPMNDLLSSVHGDINGKSPRQSNVKRESWHVRRTPISPMGRMRNVPQGRR